MRHLIGVLILIAASSVFFVQDAGAAPLSVVSDLVSTSAPSATTTHRLRFRTTNAIPVSGKIIIAPEDGAYNIPVGFDVGDVDLAIATTSSYTDRPIAASVSGVNDGVSVTTGAFGSITITLNSTEGIGAGDYVEVELGTNATFGGSGDSLISNPGTTGSYRIHVRTTNASDTTIDNGVAMIAIINSVGVHALPRTIPPVRSNGLPSGDVAAGNELIELSLNTNEYATCRYSTIADTDYDAMTETFLSASLNRIHYLAVDNHANGSTYTYFVRCEDFYGLENDDDFEITFTLLDEEETTGVGGSDGAGGVGSIAGGSTFLYLSSVLISGWASPQSTVYILKDGKQQATAQTQTSGSFTTSIAGLERGAYTFSVYTQDRAQRKSATYTATLTLNQGTMNTLSNILIPPSISIENDTIDVGDELVVSGTSVPGSTLDVFLIADSGSLGASKQYVASSTKGVSSSSDGDWSVTIPARDLSRGTYAIRARATSEGALRSNFSTILYLGVGESPSPDFSIRSDINKDGKVNLVDFSILLSNWGTDNVDSDINSDGIINLADVSIMLFNWTG